MLQPSNQPTPAQLAKLWDILYALEPRCITMYVPDGKGREVVVTCATRELQAH